MSYDDQMAWMCLGGLLLAGILAWIQTWSPESHDALAGCIAILGVIAFICGIISLFVMSVWTLLN